MNNIFKFSIVTSFLGLWIATHIPEKFELILGFILIFSFGMIHGSNDLLIINKILEKSKYYSKFNILVAYLMIVSLAILIFYMAPILALSMFVIFSAYHFGEQHWEKSFIKSNNSLKSIFYFCYGMLILQLLFTFNDIGVKFIVKEITGYQIANLNSFPIIIILGSLVLIMTAIELHFKRISSEIALTELFSLLILTIIFNSSSLIWGFTIYFILWHSVPSLAEQIKFVYGEFKLKTTLKYCKSAAPYWIVSLIGMVILYFMFNNEKHFYSLFFAFIAAVTFPHAFVMVKMFSKKKHEQL
ncbi:MAG: beta-carotene 15,15'-dioxygenase, Brp/Blh family [Formosa sp.]|jgi:beta-carotene 15,15'-dioxygenase|nr:beta-carotene 15,15'-dioxygenase, Brp/Blh family [Formosa sp.]MBT5439340.1 beta-carotene 15,15'-dioxygenase, Brp/Blh family [Flavobacteriales bacterium]